MENSMQFFLKLASKSRLLNKLRGFQLFWFSLSNIGNLLCHAQKHGKEQPSFED